MEMKATMVNRALLEFSDGTRNSGGDKTECLKQLESSLGTYLDSIYSNKIINDLGSGHNYRYDIEIITNFWWD